jgi:hypothetical protein
MDYLPPVEERERDFFNAGGRWRERENLRLTPVAGGVRERICD